MEGGGELELSGKASAEQTCRPRVPEDKGLARWRKWEGTCRQKEWCIQRFGDKKEIRVSGE